VGGGKNPTRGTQIFYEIKSPPPSGGTKFPTPGKKNHPQKTIPTGPRPRSTTPPPHYFCSPKKMNSNIRPPQKKKKFGHYPPKKKKVVPPQKKAPVPTKSIPPPRKKPLPRGKFQNRKETIPCTFGESPGGGFPPPPRLLLGDSPPGPGFKFYYGVEKSSTFLGPTTTHGKEGPEGEHSAKNRVPPPPKPP